jgi:hypothetical protein
MEQAEASLASSDLDLASQIRALQDAVPELGSGTAPAKVDVAAPRAATGTWPALRRLLDVQRTRNSLEELAVITRGLASEVDAQLGRTQDAVRELSERLRAAAGTPADGGATPTGIDERSFRGQLEHLKALVGVVVPLRAESALLHRFAGDLEAWRRALGRETRHVLTELALGLVGVAVALVLILIGAALWRVATLRYIADPTWRRLSLTARRVATVVALALVVIFHFTSELTALVTALGFAAAGIAFALQTVILAVAGYFSMAAPNGIRVGDRVSLQGPFSYVHGEVIDIGFVRIRLRELSADGLEPTGRVVVFPNSVVFTGSFFKHPPAATHATATGV